MAWIETIDETDAEGPLAELYRAAADPGTGRVDNIVKIHSAHPEGLAGHLGLYRAVMRGTAGLPKVDRELIAFAVSGVNGCHY